MKDFVPLLQTVLWVSLMGIALFYFRSSLFQILNAIGSRLEAGASIKLGSFELGELKSELNKATAEVKDTKQIMQQELDKIGRRFESLVKKSQEFMQPKPLEAVWWAVDELECRLSDDPLSQDELMRGIRSMDAVERLPAYIELQLRPKANMIDTIVNCLYEEMSLARSSHETRPMWQAIKTLDRTADSHPDLAPSDRQSTSFALRQLLEFLRANRHLDPGGECKGYAESVIKKLG